MTARLVCLWIFPVVLFIHLYNIIIYHFSRKESKCVPLLCRDILKYIELRTHQKHRCLNHYHHHSLRSPLKISHLSSPLVFLLLLLLAPFMRPFTCIFSFHPALDSLLSRRSISANPFRRDEKRDGMSTSKRLSALYIFIRN